MEKITVMKSGLLITAILGSFVSANAGLALDGKVFPGKGSKETWLSASRHGNDGIALTKAKKYDVAAAKIQQSIAMYPYADAFYRNLGVVYEERAKPGDLQKAEAAYRKACDLDPKDWQNWNALANVVGDQQRFKECRDALKKAVTCNPPNNALAEINKQIKNLDNYLVTQK